MNWTPLHRSRPLLATIVLLTSEAMPILPEDLHRHNAATSSSVSSSAFVPPAARRRLPGDPLPPLPHFSVTTTAPWAFQSSSRARSAAVYPPFSGGGGGGGRGVNLAASSSVDCSEGMLPVSRTYDSWPPPTEAARNKDNSSSSTMPSPSSVSSTSSVSGIDADAEASTDAADAEASTDASASPASASAVTTEQCDIRYRIYRRMNLSSTKAAPLVVLHGGPSVPSDYLYPLADVVPYRSIVFYDQLGCGRSPGPEDVRAYSISEAIDDLEVLLKKLNLRRFHLYGQSFGGLLAFEYLKRVAERKGERAADPDEDEDEGCLSVILSSSPTNVKFVESEAERLLAILREEDDNAATLGDRFRLRHQCRIDPMPPPLVDAYAHAGTVWRGTTAIPDYVARPPSDRATRLPSAMVLRGEHDFVGSACVDGWTEAFGHGRVRNVVMAGCAHHGLLENGRLYGDVVDSFLSEYD